MLQIVGRDAERQAIHEFLDEHARRPAARTLLIRGEAGIGKTILWREATDDARRTCQVLTARPAEAESQLGFTVLADLLQQLPGALLAELPRPQRQALEVALLRADPVAQPPQPRAFGMGLLGALRAAAAAQPVLIAIDDLQWADPESMAALHFAVRRLEEEPVAVLATWRDSRAAPAIPASWPSPTVVAIGPLSSGALRRVLFERLGLELSRPELRRLSDAARGNPFVALELAAADLRRQAGDDRLPGMPATTTESAILERVAPLPDRTRRCLLQLAAAGGLPDRPAWSRALGPAREAGLAVLEAGRWTFSHPLHSAAIYESATQADRRAAHARLAALADRPEERSRHLAHALEPPDEAVAVQLEAAAEAAAGRGASYTAGELMELATRFSEPGAPAARTRRLLRAADAMNRAGDGARARTMVNEELARLPSGSRERAQSLIWMTDSEHTVVLGEEAVRAAGHEPDLLAAAYSALSEAHFQEGDVRAALADAKAGLAAARRTERPEIIVRALAHVGFLSALSGREDGRSFLLEGLALPQDGDPNLVYHGPATSLAVLDLWSDRYEPARAALQAMVERSARNGDDWVRAALLNHLFKVEWRAGNRQRVRELAAELEELNATGGWSRPAVSDWQQGLAAAGFGQLGQAREIAHRGLALAAESEDRLYHLYHRSLLGFVEVSAGDAGAALVHLRHFARDLAAIGIAEPGVFCTSSDELEALVAAGELDRAARRIGEIEARGVELGRPRELDAAYRGRALLAAAGGDLETAMEWAHRAVAQHEPHAIPLERGRSLLVLGNLARRARRRREARDALESAVALFDGLGAATWAARARDELARIGGRRPAGDVLTPTEHRVASLASVGLTTREIASELVVSPRTVEGHLGRVYEKLGVRSRAELARHPELAGERPAAANG